jgi:hypothetical protein
MLWAEFCGDFLRCSLGDGIICVSMCVYGRYGLGIANKFRRPWLPFSICSNTDSSPPGIIIAFAKVALWGECLTAAKHARRQENCDVCNHVRCMDYSDVTPNSYMIMAFSARRELSKGVKCNKFCLRFPQRPNFCVAAVFAKFLFVWTFTILISHRGVRLTLQEEKCVCHSSWQNQAWVQDRAVIRVIKKYGNLYTAKGKG